MKASEHLHPRATIGQVLVAVCNLYSIREEDLCSRGRQKPLAEARAVVALLVRETEQLRVAELGRKLNRDLSGL